MYYTFTREVDCHEVDKNNNIKPSELVRFLENAADHQMRDRKPSYTELFGMGKAFILSRLSVEVFSSLHQYDEAYVRTWNSEAKAATFYRGYSIYRGDEEVIRAVGEWAVVDVNDGHIYLTKEIDISTYEKDALPKLDIPTRFRLSKDAEYSDAGTRRVMLSDCDMNMHMNNTMYPNMLWNTVPDIEEMEVTSINMRFRTEAPKGALIEIERAEIDVGALSDPRAEEGYAFRTFADGKPNLEAMVGLRCVS